MAMFIEPTCRWLALDTGKPVDHSAIASAQKELARRRDQSVL
jgi:hypothetical protein